MKNLISAFLLFTTICSVSFGATFEEAKTLYNKRAVNAEGFESARSAAKLGVEIGQNHQNSPDVSASGYLVACKALFFLGDYLPVSRLEKKNEYKASYELCKKGIELIEDPTSKGEAKKEEWDDLLNDIYFVYTSSFGRWFEDESKLRALGYWKDDVKPILERLEENAEHIYGFGPLRALGRAYFAIPGGRNRAVDFLEDAYEKSLSETLNVPLYPLTTAYYAEALIDKGHKDEAKEILIETLNVADSGKLQELHDEAFKTFGEYRWAETQEEIKLCRKILKEIE